MKRSMHVPDQRTSKQQRDNMRGFRKKFQRASRGGGATVVTAILGDEVKTVHVTLATGSRAPTEAAWRRFCTVFPGLPSSVFGSQSTAMVHSTTHDGKQQCSVDMQPADFNIDEGHPVVGCMEFDAAKCHFEVHIDVDAFDECFRMTNKEAPARVAAAAPSRSDHPGKATAPDHALSRVLFPPGLI